MGLALLVWRDEVYRLPLGWFQSDLSRMGVTLLGCFSILRFEITKIYIKELIRDKEWGWRFLFGEMQFIVSLW